MLFTKSLKAKRLKIYNKKSQGQEKSTMKKLLYFFMALSALGVLQINISGCAQILAPTGGLRDSIPPKLISADPKEFTTNFKGDHITLNFDEYIQLDNIQQNLTVSPTPKTLPNINYKLRSVTIKLKDTLKANTTYSINFGNSLKDLNEGNPFRKYTYVFSTGSYIDSLEYSGKVFSAETGKADSTLQVFLYRDAPDSAIEHRRPDYISNLDSSGNFSFSFLPPGTYKVYAIKDGDGSKTYNSTSELFAFLNKPVAINLDTPDDTLYFYQQEKEKPRSPSTTTIKSKNLKDIKLKITSAVSTDRQDLNKPFSIDFNVPLKTKDLSKILLTDTLFQRIPIDSVRMDSTNTNLKLYSTWIEDSNYKIIVPKDFALDTLGNSLARADTINFQTKKNSDYGSLQLQFTNLDLSQNPVLQFIYNGNIVNSYPLISLSWSRELILPNEYEFRILYDLNKNGKWDAGNYHLKIQPERVIGVKRKFTVRPNFHGDYDIDLK